MFQEKYCGNLNFLIATLKKKIKIKIVELPLYREDGNEEEKIMFVVVWLRVENWRGFGGAHKFTLLPYQNIVSPNWRENRGEKCANQFGQNCP